MLKVISTILIFILLIPECGYARQQQIQPGVEIKGVVKDQQGAVIVGAKVTIEDSHKNSKELTTDARGRFIFSNIPFGSYLIRITANGFALKEEQLKIGDSNLRSQISITLFPEIKDTISVSDQTNGVTLDPEHAAGTITLKEKDIAALSDDPDEFASRLQLMATMAGGIPGGATVTVDGFIVHGRLPSKGSIREIRINPDLYSAEYDKAPYKGGRIEIFTKPGAEAFHGSGFFNFNNSALNARNAFATTKPPTETRRYGFEMGGPVVSKKSGFFLSFERREIDEDSTINAIALDNTLQPVSVSQNVPSPMRLTVGSTRFDWQINPASTLVARYDFNENRLLNQGIGGFNLADRGFNTNTVEHTFRFTDTTVIGTSMVNEARLGITYIRVGETALSSATAILVPGAFSSGGNSAQSQLSNDLHLEIDDILSLMSGKHKIKIGGQILGKLSGDTRTDNFNGTYVFGGGLAPELDSNNQEITNLGGPVLINISGLEQYRRTELGLPGGTPTRFSITSGDPSVHVNQWLFSAFVQDEWKRRQNLTVSMGLRYEGQTNPTDKLSLAPRLGVAYAVDKKQHWIVRVHAGMFYKSNS